MASVHTWIDVEIKGVTLELVVYANVDEFGSDNIELSYEADKYRKLRNVSPIVKDFVLSNYGDLIEEELYEVYMEESYRGV